MKIDNLTGLQVLVQTARTGTLTAAANAMDLTPAAASAALKRLERQLGTRLFERSTRAMRLTSQGQSMLEYARRALDLLAEGESLMESKNTKLVGTLRVASPSDLTRTILLPWISAFLKQNPGVRMSLLVGDRPQDVVRDEVDVALRYGTLEDSQLVARKLFDARRVLCAAPTYLKARPEPRTPEELKYHNCLMFHRAGQPHYRWRFRKDGHWTEVHVQGDRVADDASLIREWAIAGEGVILKSELELRNELSGGDLVRLLPDWETETYPLHALLPSGRFVPERVRAFVDFLAAKFAEAARAA